MKLWWLVVMLLLIWNSSISQKKWDGGAGSASWTDPQNWYPDGIPGIEDDVILDNQWLVQNYQVDLPGGTNSALLKSISIAPAPGSIIILHLPVANLAIPGLALSSTGNALELGNGGLFINASGAASGNPFQIAGKMKINDGGRYIHRTQRGNAELIDKLNLDAGTEKGIFEFDVPGTTGYTVSLTGNSFGSLRFNASAAGGSKSYSGSGASTLNIRGDLIIEQGVQLTSTMTADILLNGSLWLYGKLNLNPVTVGTNGRSFVFTGKDVFFRGTGTFSMNAYFRNLLVAKNASLALETPCHLYFTPNNFICQGQLDCGEFVIDGPGSFLLSDSASFISRADSGIWSTAMTGNIKTAFRSFSSNANYHYKGFRQQVSGDGIPDTVASLLIDNRQHLILSKPVYVLDSLLLLHGNLKTDSLRPIILAGAQVKSPANNFGITNAGWEQSFVDGFINIHSSDSSWHTIPLGVGNKFAPIRVKPPSTQPYFFSAAFKSGTHQITDMQSTLNRLSHDGYYLINTNAMEWHLAIGTSPVDSALSITEVPTIAHLQSLGSKWGAVLSEPSSTTPGYNWIYTDTVISESGYFTVGYSINNLLPLNILEFTAVSTGTYSLITWKADQDGEQTEYIIERSSDGRVFTPLHKITSTAHGHHSWQWKDHRPFKPSSIYRLLQKADGRSNYSQEVRVNFLNQAIKIYPNPAIDFIIINFPDSRSIYELNIVNRNGIVLSKHFVKTGSCQIGVSELPSGVYFIKMHSTEGLLTVPFTKY